MGFGILPKYIMLDPDLTIEAKTIYAYFCSYAGNGNTAFPSRSKIIFDLGINKDTYYKHFDLLTKQGYITTQQSIGDNSRFSNNIYTLVSNPKKFQDQPMDKKHNAAYSRIRVSGLKANGYGTIPKAVMLDKRLPLKSKGIYAYFCSFTGSGNNAFPKKQDILFHLGISHSTYEKFYRVLVTLNYITTKQRHIDGRLSVNDYYLVDTPDLAAVEIKQPRKKVSGEHLQCANFSDTESQANQYTKISDTVKTIQYTNFSDTEKQDTEKQDTEKQDTEISDSNINNPTKNSFSSINHSLKKQTAKPESERMSEDDKEKFSYEVWQELMENQKIPYYYNSDPMRMEEAIHIMTEWDKLYPNGYHNDFDQSVYNIFNVALIEMCCASGTIKVKTALINYSKVIDKINELAKFEYGYIDISEFSDPAMENFKKAAMEREIKNPTAYMKSCIWDAMQTGQFSLYAALRRDGY